MSRSRAHRFLLTLAATQAPVAATVGFAADASLTGDFGGSADAAADADSSLPLICAAGDVSVARSEVTLAELSLVDVPTVGDVVTVQDGELRSQSAMDIVTISGSTRGVRSRTVLQLPAIELLGGTTEELDVVTSPDAVLTATATGAAEGASWTYSAPSVTVSRAGTPVPGGPTVRLELGEVATTTAGDGSVVSAPVDVLGVEVVESLTGVTVVDLALGAGEASAHVPAGGIDCDTDNDGLTDPDELANGTNPNHPDTDARSDGEPVPEGPAPDRAPAALPTLPVTGGPATGMVLLAAGLLASGLTIRRMARSH